MDRLIDTSQISHVSLNTIILILKCNNTGNNMTNINK